MRTLESGIRTLKGIIAVSAVMAAAFNPNLVAQTTQTRPATPGTPAQMPAPQTQQTPQTPPGATTQPPSLAALAAQPTGILRGRITAGDNGTPLRRVEMQAVNSAVLRNTRSTITDEQGRYEFMLAAGRYTLNAVRNGYVTTAYGQKKPGDERQNIDLAAGQTITIDLTLPRGSAIVAHVTDDFGEPLPGVAVRLLRMEYMDGQRRLQPIDRPAAATNDKGEARIADLQPATYYVSATPGVLRASPSLDSSNSNRRFASTFFPGAPSDAQAQGITIGVGQQATVTFPIAAVPTARLSGTARKSDGSAVSNGWLMLQSESSSGISMSVIPVAPDGSFSVPDVVPGNYAIVVRPGFGPPPPPPTPGSQPQPLPQIPAEYARLPITVNGEDLNRLEITSARGAYLRGQIEFDEAAPPAPTPMQRPILGLAAAGPSFLNRGVSGVKDDWSFELFNVVGTGYVRLARAQGGPWDWDIKSVTIDGKDVTDTPMDFGGTQNFDNVRVVATKKRTTVTGVVNDSLGRPLNDYVAVIFADDHDLWKPQSRFIGTSRPDQKGAYRIASLPAGRYLAVAVPALEVGAERDPVILQKLEIGATPFTLSEGESKTLNLRLTTP